MLNYILRYIGQVASGDPNYPYGRAQNVVVEGDGNGTPLEEDLVNDIFGIQQAMLAAGGVTPNGSPETALDSDFVRALYRIGRWAKGWGAVGDDATDDTAALQAGLNAVAALGSGLQEFHLWPGAIYRHTGLTVPANVSIICHGAELKINHASNAALTYSNAGGSGMPLRLVGARFSANVANTGASVRLTAIVNLSLESCVFGASAGCNGKFVDMTGVTGPTLTISDCWFTSWASAVQLDLTIGTFRLARCRHNIPATYSVAAVKIDAAKSWIESPYFDVRSHSSGSMVCIEYTSASGDHHVDDATFLNDTDPAASVAIKWGANACKLIERGSVFGGNITPYEGSVVLADGSSLDLRPHGSDVTTDDTYILPDDYRAFALSGDIATSPVVLTMPAMRYPGQEYDIQLYNSDGAVDWADVQLNALGPSVATGGATLANGQIRTGRLKVMRDHFQDRWYWMLIGDWSTMFGRAAEIQA